MVSVAEWRPIPGFDAYEVSEFGDVRRCRDGAENINRSMAGKLMRPYSDQDGYLRMGLRRGRRQHKRGVHQLVALAFIGPRPTPRHEAAHNDGVRKNNHYSNLRWATRQENSDDRLKHGTLLMGRKNTQAVLNEDLVRLARRLRVEGKTFVAIGRAIGASNVTAYNVIAGRAWGWLP